MKAPETKLIDGIRFYNCGGEWLPSVTSILKATGDNGAWMGWQRAGGEAAKAKSQSARDRGTTIHEFCERRLRGYRAAAKVPEHLRPYWDSVQPALRRLKLARLTEAFVWHRQQRYAGTLDAVATYRGVKDTLIDFKTTQDASRIDGRLAGYRLQLAAYAGALLDTRGIEVQQAVIIVIHPDGPAQDVIVTRAELAELWSTWCDRCAGFTSSLERKAEKRAAVVNAFQW
jgi:hypothetical protein